MISVRDYFGTWADSADVTPERQANALKLLEAVNAMMAEMEDSYVFFQINPFTRSQISGNVFGGFRPQSCKQGSTRSAHKDALAVDIYDPSGQIDDWLQNNVAILSKYNIYIEAPASTTNWTHWSIRPPKSGRHIFKP